MLIPNHSPADQLMKQQRVRTTGWGIEPGWKVFSRKDETSSLVHSSSTSTLAPVGRPPPAPARRASLGGVSVVGGGGNNRWSNHVLRDLNYRPQRSSSGGNVGGGGGGGPGKKYKNQSQIRLSTDLVDPELPVIRNVELKLVGSMRGKIFRTPSASSSAGAELSAAASLENLGLSAAAAAAAAADNKKAQPNAATAARASKPIAWSSRVAGGSLRSPPAAQTLRSGIRRSSLSGCNNLFIVVEEESDAEHECLLHPNKSRKRLPDEWRIPIREYSKLLGLKPDHLPPSSGSVKSRRAPPPPPPPPPPIRAPAHPPPPIRAPPPPPIRAPAHLQLQQQQAADNQHDAAGLGPQPPAPPAPPRGGVIGKRNYAQMAAKPPDSTQSASATSKALDVDAAPRLAAEDGDAAAVEADGVQVTEAADAQQPRAYDHKEDMRKKPPPDLGPLLPPSTRWSSASAQRGGRSEPPPPMPFPVVVAADDDEEQDVVGVRSLSTGDPSVIAAVVAVGGQQQAGGAHVPPGVLKKPGTYRGHKSLKKVAFLDNTEFSRVP